jgi:hypothetical protein
LDKLYDVSITNFSSNKVALVTNTGYYLTSNQRIDSSESKYRLTKTLSADDSKEFFINSFESTLKPYKTDRDDDIVLRKTDSGESFETFRYNNANIGPDGKSYQSELIFICPFTFILSIGDKYVSSNYDGGDSHDLTLVDKENINNAIIFNVVPLQAVHNNSAEFSKEPMAGGSINVNSVKIEWEKVKLI